MKDIQCSTGNFTQYSVKIYMRKEYKKEGIYVWTDSLYYAAETNTTL